MDNSGIFFSVRIAHGITFAKDCICICCLRKEKPMKSSSLFYAFLQE